MSKKKIEKFMTPFPHCIHPGLPLKAAKEMMKKFEIRHLPVQYAGNLVGVLSDRDLKLGASLDPEGRLTIEDVMTPDPYSVSPTSDLSEVTAQMAKHKYGCAIVRDDRGKVTGIFTATDALGILSRSLAPSRPKSKAKKPTRKERKDEAHRNLD